MFWKKWETSGLSTYLLGFGRPVLCLHGSKEIVQDNFFFLLLFFFLNKDFRWKISLFNHGRTFKTLSAVRKVRPDNWIKNGTEGTWAKLVSWGTLFLHWGVSGSSTHFIFSMIKLKAFWNVQGYWIQKNQGQVYFCDLDSYVRERFMPKELNLVKVIALACFQSVIQR